jgi:ADP-ribose pyrophosphatase
MTTTGFERIKSEQKWHGSMLDVRVETFRHADGSEAEREVVRHMGAVGILAVDDEHVWLVRQPREAVGAEALLEIVAGKLDVDGEPPLETAKRELEEEIGKRAERWKELFSFWVTPGWSDERVTIYLAEGLSDVDDHEPDPHERIEIVPWPLERLDDAIAECEDSKSLIGLLHLKVSDTFR